VVNGLFSAVAVSLAFFFVSLVSRRKLCSFPEFEEAAVCAAALAALNAKTEVMSKELMKKDLLRCGPNVFNIIHRPFVNEMA